VSHRHDRRQGLLTREQSILVIIDVQEKLMPVVTDKERVVENTVRLARFARGIGLPVILTEQEKLGATLPELRMHLPDIEPVGKIYFNCFSCQAFLRQLEAARRQTLLLAGVEAHICVAQTVLSALSKFDVHVIGDAISSRTPANKEVALQRMRDAGAVISSTEMVIYELLERAGTEDFKMALQLVK
jgi:nicotinamidase-related amidase